MTGGGEEHDFVKIMKQVVKDVSRPAAGKFETILVNFDKINAIRSERKLTKSEQSIYEKVRRHVKSEFDAMFKRSEPILAEVRKRAGATSAQHGGEPPADAKAADAKDEEGVAPEAKAPEAKAAEAEAKEAEAKEAEAKEAAAKAKEAEDAAKAKEAEDAAKAKKAADAAKAKAEADAAAAKAAAEANKGLDSEAKAKTDADTDEPKIEASGAKKETPWSKNWRFILWIWNGIKELVNKVINFFVGLVDDKMKALMIYFSVDHLMEMLGNDLTRVKNLGESLETEITKLQKTVVSGISGAATASIDMVLNAFSMMPAIGTTILVWRMFQNLLVIIGATLSVQSGKTGAATAVGNASGASLADAERANKEIDGLKPINSRIKANNRLTSEGGGGGGKRAPPLSSKTLKKVPTGSSGP